MHCLFLSVENILSPDDTQYRPYFWLCPKGLCFCSVFKFSIQFLRNLAPNYTGMSEHLSALCHGDKNILPNDELSTHSNSFVLTVIGVNCFDGAALFSFTLVSCILLFLLYHREGPILDNPISLLFRERRPDWPLLDQCQLFVGEWGSSPGRAASYTFVYNVPWYVNFCTRAFLWLLQFDHILNLMDCSCPWKKILFRTYSS